MFPLPKLTPDLNRVLCYRMATTDAKAFCPDSQLKRNEMMWNWLFDEDELTYSNVWIFDLTNMDSIAIWAHFNLSFMKKILKISMVIIQNLNIYDMTFKMFFQKIISF